MDRRWPRSAWANGEAGGVLLSQSCNLKAERVPTIDSQGTPLSGAALADRYRRNRARSGELFALLSDDAYYSRPIALRHPIVFYEGHLPGFSFNTLIKKALAGQGLDPRLEDLFARGIDPHESSASAGHVAHVDAGWPSRDEVRAFAAEADRRVLEALSSADMDRPGHPHLDRADAVFTILEHEAMHQETLR